MIKLFHIFKKLLKRLSLLAGILDILLLPLTILSLVWYRIVKFWGISKFPLTRKMFYEIGVAPIVKHYYEPLFDIKQLSKPLHSKRRLSIELNLKMQTTFIEQLQYQDELVELPVEKVINSSTPSFYYNNGSFPSGDAELYYSIIRHIKPYKIIEIGSGFSTLIAIEAIKKNDKNCPIICIEPFENNWLEKMGVKVIRKKVETIDIEFFKQLEKNDILFIDSSHIIRPQGDVLYEILELLPKLNKGVLIHFHDIFTPKDYPEEWLTEEFRLWNEQYLLESLLTNNPYFEIVCSLNYLNENYKDLVNQVFPVLARQPFRNPGSFWIRKTN